MKLLSAIGAALLAAGMTSGASAQALNFDEVCASPPCSAGTAYQASWGVTVAPASTPIVAGGTTGLTGTAGGAFLAIDAFPFQATITLGRSATFVAVDVSRATGTTAGQTFTLQALNNGSPVGTPQTVTLGGVNTWTTVSVTVPAGFNGLFLDSGAGGVTKTFGIDNVRLAGNCAGFVDVAPSDVFCNAGEWLYNRGVTLGCTLGSYCPSGNVTRAQMALFMQRLGNALTPTELFVDTGLGLIDLEATPAPVICVSSPFVVAGFPRSATATGNFTAIANGDVDFTMTLVRSTDGGSTWTAMNSRVAAAGGTAARVINGTVMSGAQPLAVGSTNLFGIRLGRLTQISPNTGDISASNCHLRVTIDNRTSVTAPFDEPPPSRPIGR